MAIITACDKPLKTIATGVSTTTTSLRSLTSEPRRRRTGRTQIVWPGDAFMTFGETRRLAAVHLACVDSAAGARGEHADVEGGRGVDVRTLQGQVIQHAPDGSRGGRHNALL